MSKRISKRVREEAAMLLSACACCGENQYRVLEDGFPDASREALSLMYSAFAAASIDSEGYPFNATLASRWYWAEAEALLRTGWTPT